MLETALFCLSIKIDVLLSDIKSVETTSSAVKPKTPSYLDDLLSASITSQICLYEVSDLKLTVRSNTETLAVGTLKAMPVNFPFIEGRTFNCFAAPVEEGIIF